MKIYIVTDLEGISGIDRIDMIDRDNPQYDHSIERLMLDVNAAVEGALEGGAREVLVLDGHGGGDNFKLEMLHPKAIYDTGKMTETLDRTFDAVMFVGTHAMAGTINGFLDHTQSSRSWFNYWVNGRRMGEIAQWAIMAGNYDLPVIMVSGDEAACIEARQFFHLVECAAVKRGIGRNRAELVDNDKALEIIKEAAKKSMSLIGTAKPFKPILPLDIKLELYRSDYCDAIATKLGIERLDARTVRKVSNSYLDIFF